MSCYPCTNMGGWGIVIIFADIVFYPASLCSFRDKNSKEYRIMKASVKRKLDAHPLKKELKDIVLDSWKQIFDSKIGEYQIGKDIFPSPQIISFFLHELVAHNISQKHSEYRVGVSKDEKDIHCISNIKLGIEIKGSSNKSQIFANRSYAQPSSESEVKSKNGYYLAINFEKLSKDTPNPKILLIRFGYLVHEDWIPQASETGQQARLAPKTYNEKFEILYQSN